MFDLETVYAVPETTGTWQGKMHKRPDGSYMLFNSLPLPIENNIATVICRYELVEKTEILKTEMEHFQIKLYRPTEMDTILKEVGFSHVKRVAAYDHNAMPSAQDYTIAYECIK